MRLARSENPLPTRFAGHPAAKGLLHEFSVRITPRGKAAKVLVFKNWTAMKNFWRDALGGHLERGVGGVVTPLCADCYYFDTGEESHYKMVDPNFFCVVGLRADFITEEVVAHEAVHVGGIHAETSPVKWPGQEDREDERIAYPAGRFYWQTMRKLRAAGLARGLE